MQPVPTYNYDELAAKLAHATADALGTCVVNAPFEDKVQAALLFLGFICFYLVDETKRVVYLVAASDTEQYELAVRDIRFKVEDYHISLDDTDNSIVQAIDSGQPVVTTDWATLSRQASAQGTARLNQASSGIAHSVVYPLLPPMKGALMYNYFQYQEHMGPQQADFMERYTRLVSERLAEN